jgi:putative PIN family toxin of toxin-antitoxin system
MRVILDTNVLLSAFFKVESPPYELVHAWMDGRFHLLSSSEQIEEITRVARYPQVRRLIQPAEIGWLVNRLRGRATLLTDLPSLNISPDPADNFLFSMAEIGGATHLVTGDKSGVLRIRKHRSTHIVTARQMVAFLKL